MKNLEREATVSLDEARCAAKMAIRDCGIAADGVKVLQEEEASDRDGDYANSQIRIYGAIKISAVLHEAAHHIHEVRNGEPPQVPHNITFHRICFEIRDNFRHLYGLDIRGINGIEDSVSYEKALYEWFNRQGESKGERRW